MTTELRHLRIVVAAADAGSFSAAAHALNLDVSVVSRMIRDLELSIGTSVFERLPRGVRLTKTGADYLTSARDILARVDHANQVASLAASGSTGNLALGFVWSFNSGPVVEMLRTFRTALPAVSVRTVEDGNNQLVSRLRDADLDIALAATEPPTLRRLRSIGVFSTLPLWLEPLCAVVPDSFKQGAATWGDLAEQPLLCQPKDDQRRFVEHVERFGGPTLRFAAQDVSRDGLLGLVAAGLGWAIIPASIAHLDIPGLRTVPIDSEGAVLQIEAIWDARTDNPALTRFLELARQMYP